MFGRSSAAQAPHAAGWVHFLYYSACFSPLDQEIKNHSYNLKKKISLALVLCLPPSSQHPAQSSQHIPAQEAEHFTQQSSTSDEHTGLSVLRQL